MKQDVVAFVRSMWMKVRVEILFGIFASVTTILVYVWDFLGLHRWMSPYFAVLIYFVLTVFAFFVIVTVGYIVWWQVRHRSDKIISKEGDYIIEPFTHTLDRWACARVHNKTKEPVECYASLGRLLVFLDYDHDARKAVNPNNLRLEWARDPSSEYITIAPDDHEVINIAKSEGNHVSFLFYKFTSPFMKEKYEVRVELYSEQKGKIAELKGIITPTEQLPFPYNLTDALDFKAA